MISFWHIFLLGFFIWLFMHRSEDFFHSLHRSKREFEKGIKKNPSGPRVPDEILPPL